MVRCETFERGDAGISGCGERSQTGARRFAVEVHGAGAALTDAAAILGGMEVEQVTDDPEERGVGRRVDSGGPAVDGQVGRHMLNSKDTPGARSEGRGIIEA